MRALLLDGLLEADASSPVHEIIITELERAGWMVEAVILRDVEIADCLGCFGCWVRTPGVCVLDDAARDITRRMVQSDLTIYLTGVTFGGYSSELKKAVDRIICLLSPFFMRINGEVHHRPRYERYPRLVGVGVLSCPDEESERLFTTLVERNAINLHSPAHGAGVVLTDQGAEQMRERVRSILGKAGV